jgi:hypothetical protein
MKGPLGEFRHSRAEYRSDGRCLPRARTFASGGTCRERHCALHRPPGSKRAAHNARAWQSTGSALRVRRRSTEAGRRSPEQRGHLVFVSHMTTLIGRRWATPPFRRRKPRRPLFRVTTPLRSELRGAPDGRQRCLPLQRRPQRCDPRCGYRPLPVPIPIPYPYPYPYPCPCPMRCGDDRGSGSDQL